MDLSVIDIKKFTLLEIEHFLDAYVDEDAPLILGDYVGDRLKMLRNAIDTIFYDYGHHDWDDARITKFTKFETVTGHAYEIVITNENGDEKYVRLQTS